MRSQTSDFTPVAATGESLCAYALLTSVRRLRLAMYKLHDGWRRGVVVSGVCRMNEVNARRARLALG